MRIAVTGKMCSGKTTLCNYLCELEPRFEIFSFGKKVKQCATDLFGMNPFCKDRPLLISLGQKMREIDSEVWINYVNHWISLQKARGLFDKLSAKWGL